MVCVASRVQQRAWSAADVRGRPASGTSGFFLGGLIAGATAIWKGLFSGLLHGFMVWSLGVVAFIALTFFGGSALLGMPLEDGIKPRRASAY